ncbi:thiamine pyrophosphate-dependent enzyme [Nocardia yamanashiensis]|uniref:thiamine pyrophosphate-binding protein n=1 Tax=Nocardia yamanashiensis TaxID=209247 RepID=UPI001E5282AD|nr:thiamine pyrophosphate-binding protein [Nocardia yamanashiensis]UGT45004.1 thiamine pyrophosphate-dependent enzyme [Nocardia yamanashiensis]
MYRSRSISAPTAEPAARPDLPTVADLIVTRLAARTTHVFGVGGANIEDLYDALHRTTHPITGIVAKHEFGAATMADGYFRATGRLGVVAATSGGGAMNLLAGLTESYDSRIPVLALIGQPPLTLEGRGAFQDTSGGPGLLDAERIFAAVARHCEKVVEPAEIDAALDRALAAAVAGGPAVLLLPKDIQSATAQPRPAGRGADAVRSPFGGAANGATSTANRDPSSGHAAAAASGVVAETGVAAHDSARADADAAARAVGSLLAAVRGPVVLIAGPEVGRAGARAELARLAGVLDATVLVTPDAKDAFPNRDSRFGGITGIMGHPHVPELVGRAAVCVLVGATLPMTARAGLDEPLLACARVVSVGGESPYARADVQVPGELRARLQDLLGQLPEAAGRSEALASRRADGLEPRHSGGLPAGMREPGVDPGRQHVGTTEAVALPGMTDPGRSPGVALPELVVPPATGPGVRYREAVLALRERLEPGTTVVADAGNTGAAVVHYLPVPEDGRFLIALGMGGMGYAFGAGIGAALGRGRRSVVIAGDGAYFMHGHEVHTAVEYHVPVTFVVFNNNAHAMCVTREQLYYSGEYTYNRFGQARIGAAMAAMFPQLPVFTASTLEEFERALDESRTTSGPAFIELRCDPDEIPPFAPFLKELSA